MGKEGEKEKKENNNLAVFFCFPSPRFQDQAVDLLYGWAAAQKLEGMALEVVRLEG